MGRPTGFKPVGQGAVPRTMRRRPRLRRPNARPFDPGRRNENLAGNLRDTALVVHELGREEVDGSGSHVGTTMMDAGKPSMSFNPVVYDQPNVLRNADLELFRQPVRHIGIESDDDVRAMLLEPGAEDVGFMSEVVFAKQQERHPVFGGDLLLEIEHGTRVRVVRAGIDPLCHRQADTSVSPRMKLCRGLQDAAGHIGAGAVKGGILQAVAEGGGGEARVVELRADILRGLRRDDQSLDATCIQNLDKPLGGDAAPAKKKLLGAIAVLFRPGANIARGDVLICRIVQLILGNVIADDGNDGLRPSQTMIANPRHELGDLRVGSVAKFFDRSLDSSSGGGTNVRRVVEHTRHCHGRHARGGGDRMEADVVWGFWHEGLFLKQAILLKSKAKPFNDGIHSIRALSTVCPLGHIPPRFKARNRKWRRRKGNSPSLVPIILNDRMTRRRRGGARNLLAGSC